MPNPLKGALIVVVSTCLSALTVFLASAALDVQDKPVAALVGAIIGLLYGLEAGILLIYDLNTPKGWLQLVCDSVWSLPNTTFGFVLGNIFYPFFGRLSRSDSERQGWIVYLKRSHASDPRRDVHQTLGTVNLGGAGQHERMHLLQARIFGPLFLPLYAVFYIVTSLLQLIFTLTLGMGLWLLKARDTPYLRPPQSSVVQGFFGWIYYATPFELWGYAAGNP